MAKAKRSSLLAELGRFLQAAIAFATWVWCNRRRKFGELPEATDDLLWLRWLVWLCWSIWRSLQELRAVDDVFQGLEFREKKAHRRHSWLVHVEVTVTDAIVDSSITRGSTTIHCNIHDWFLKVVATA